MVLLDNGGRRVGTVDVLAPAANLSRIVEHAWIDESRYPTAIDWRVVADVSPHLIATVTERAGTRAMRVALVGARATAATIDIGERVLTVGVRLRPGALPALTKLSAREFVDRSTSIDDVLAPDILEGLELGADAPPALIASELFRLMRRATERRTPPSLVSDTSPGWPRVATMAAQAGTSTRALLDRAYRHVGLSPRRMLRITRLHDALHAVRRGSRAWADIACEAGYADQPHLCRECRALLGETPSTWHARGSSDSFKTGSAAVR
jgi:AraC-like DNA-binding protein